jgi:hypothetical protein
MICAALWAVTTAPVAMGEVLELRMHLAEHRTGGRTPWGPLVWFVAVVALLVPRTWLPPKARTAATGIVF